MSTDDQLLADWRREAEQPFEGWNFGYLAGRMREDPPPWDYSGLVAERMRRAGSALDVGTGGGEQLSALTAVLPALMVATEGWPPNMSVADRRLRPLGVPVVGYHTDTGTDFPFLEATFDLVTDRHEAFSADVARILRPGGSFLTQQVGERNNAEVDTLIGPRNLPPTVTLRGSAAVLAGAGLQIERAEEFTGSMTFSDVGALVYYLQAIPWERPADFDVDRYADRLLAAHRQGPALGRPVRLSVHRFLVEARRPT